MNVIFGIFYHLIGSTASASFYVPLTKVKKWAWETYWLVNGISSWIIMPFVFGWLTTPNFWKVITESELETLSWTYFFGFLWGIGGLTFGLAMRYLGLSLGYALILGLSAAVGTLIPPLYEGKLWSTLMEPGGMWILAGIITGLTGILICGFAGVLKERLKNQITSAAKSGIAEYDLKKGLTVALISGILSACMAFGLASGKPIADIALKYGTNDVWQNNSILFVILLGGFTSNVIACVYLLIKNKRGSDFFSGGAKLLLKNYSYSLLAGSIWYLQFFFYGMGTTFMGKYEFVSWTFHMSFIILLSNIWGIYLKEWKGSSEKAKFTLILGIILIMLSVAFIGLGSTFS
ncbi:MAG: L-rhamnose/proton symporter RhaT [Cyclobacteriaceae bacterium]|nr:L-rhamnose/proton symporter RhaT [Cyclobacteriaceae bacterium]